MSAALEANVKLIHFAARRAQTRLLQAGYNAEYDDVFQDTAILWMECERKFDPEKGFQFSTYFMRAVDLTLFKRHNRRNNQFERGFESLDKEGENAPALQAIDVALGAENQMILDETVGEIARRLSPLTRRIFELLLNPPKIILDNLTALTHKGEYARSIGVDKRGYSDLTVLSLCQVLKVDNDQRRKIRKEIMRVMNDLNVGMAGVTI
jgi:DNA-directed RNA polymerase specialized sigma24 family protein